VKVAISAPDPLFRDAEAVSSQLRVTARLDAVVARLAPEDRATWEGPSLEVLCRERW
jgi:hypothetical protein